MSEASRAARQRVLNRLEELAARLGPPPDAATESAVCDPSWGPVGALARAHMDPETFAALVKRNTEMIALERLRHPPVAPPLPKVKHEGVINLDGV